MLTYLTARLFKKSFTGSTGEVMTMAYRDYAALVEPSVIPLPTINRYYAQLSAIVPEGASI